MKLQKLGGYASIVFVCIGIATTVIMFTMFQGLTGLDIYDPAKMLAAYQASPMSFHAFYVLGILTAILVLLIVLALEERMQADAPRLMRLAVIAAAVFSALLLTAMIGGFFRNELLAATNDMSAFRVFLVLHEFLGAVATSAQGWGFLLIGWAALRTRRLPRILGYIILIFGIGSIIQFTFFTVWQFLLGIAISRLLGLPVFVWLGIFLIRNPEPKLD